MRSILSRAKALVVCLLFAGAAACAQTQVNPATQVRWPALTGTVDPAPPTWVCAAANYGQPYTNTATGKQFTCAAGGWINVAAAAVPGGVNQDAQINLSGALGADTGVYTYNVATHTLNFKNALASGALTAQTTNGTLNSDSLGGVTTTLTNPLCTTAGCFFARPQTSSDTATIANLFTSSLVNIHASDLEFGSQADYFWNSSALQSGGDFRYGRSTLCGWNSAVTNIIGGRTCLPETFVFAPLGGQYVGGEPTGADLRAINFWAYTRSIAQTESEADRFYSIGDKTPHYTYVYHRSGSIASSDESIEGNAQNLISSGPPSGTVTTGGAGATTVKINFTTNAGNQADGLELIDEADVLDSGNYVGALTVGTGNAASTFQTVDINGNPVSHTVSSGIATLTSACGSTTIRNQQQSNVCSVTINSGSFTSGGTNFVCVADWHYYEQAAITATGSGTLTLNLAYSHPSGTQIFQGAGCGGRLVLGNGSAPLSTAQVTSYAVAGAPDATHYAVVVKNLGGQQGNISVPWGQLNPLIPLSIPNVVLSRTSNVVTASVGGTVQASGFNNYTAPGSSQIYVSGANPIDFNGAISGLTWNPLTRSLTYNQTGPNESSSTYATIALRGANNYSIYCGAEVTAVGGVTLSSSQTPVLDGTLQIEPNGCGWAVNDAVIQPNSYSEHLDSESRGIASDASDLQPLNNPNAGYVNSALSGAETSGFIFHSLPSGPSISNFLGHGGLYVPWTYNSLAGGVFNYFTSMLYAPEISLFNIGCPASGCSATSQVDQLFTMSGNSGTGTFGFDTHDSTWFFGNPLNAPASSVTGQQVGIEGTYAGQPLNTTMLTQTLGHNYSSFGGGNTGDSTAQIGAGTFAAGNVIAGASIPTPGGVYNIGTAGTTTYSYVCTGVSANGGETLPSASTQTTTGNATLNATNYNNVFCTGNAGDQSFNVYRTSTTGGLSAGKICSNVPVNRTNEFCNDTGQAAGSAVPTTDTSGTFTLSGATATAIAGTGPNLQSVGSSTNGYLPMFGAGGLANSHCDDGATTAGTITCTEPIKVVVTYPNSFSLSAGTGSIPALPANSGGFAAPASGGTSWLGKLPATITAGLLHFAAPATGDGVNESIITSGPVNLASADVSGVLPTANGGAGITQGTATLVAGTVTVSTSAAVAVAGGHYLLTNCGASGTAIGTLSVGTVTAGTSFVINSLTSANAVATGDTSTVCWWIR